VIVIASLLLGAVFVVSAVTKLAAPEQWRVQSGELGVPGPISTLLPFTELVVGALLVAQVARRPIAAVAGAMLLAFTVVLVVRLRQGRRPPCACFGALTTKPIGWGNVLRNAAFLAVAVAIALA
jgi:uncharacterized membrane protein YphA (DoxX/SURF4 family)